MRWRGHFGKAERSASKEGNVLFELKSLFAHVWGERLHGG
jgi:hypothetical protein